ncbi:restriction endonuclease subunit S [Polaribacter sp. L3A8]|uniref:restriction endonuclease subunit S n=1 Tax=Polaribacter sp. L3A8 TaxID=2686361 RepID=UPI00131EB2C3|nr:restriction endonuclease subunit S [Polaribacter sp. L3A8]
MGEYKFSGVVDENKVFIINHSEITERIDPIYFKSVNELVIVKKTSNPVFKLSEVVNMKRGRFGHRPRNDPKFYNGKYPFIQTGDIVKASKKGGQIPYSQTLNELGLKTSRLFEEKAIIITIAANIGDTAILDYPACFPDSLIAMTPKEEGKLQLEYLNVYFKFLKNYLNDLAPQAAQKNINYQQLAPTPIVVPPIEIQKEIVTLYKNAYNSKQQKEKEAKEILANIDTYLLNELGVILPKKDNSLNKRIFNVNFSKISGSRLDSFFNKTEYFELQNALENGKFDSLLFSKIMTDLNNGVEIRSYSNTGFRYLRVSDLGKNGINNKNAKIVDVLEIPSKIKLTYSDFLISRSGSLGLVNVVNDKVIDSILSSHIFKVSLNIELINPYYLEAFLRSEMGQIQFFRVNNGGVIPEINQTALKSISIIVPTLPKQKEIAEHISKIRAKAKQLEAEAKNELEFAKQEIEQLILGNK